jgi:DNA-binding NtrC family response regulator
MQTWRWAKGVAKWDAGRGEEARFVSATIIPEPSQVRSSMPVSPQILMNVFPNSAIDSPTKRVLIVDSQEMVRSVLCRMLKSWGLGCHPASNLLGAYRAVMSEGPFDAVVCDYELSDGNAFDLAALMRERGITAPMVAPVGSPEPLAKPAAGVELLAKPFDPIELKRALERALGIRLPKEANPVQVGESAAVRG